MTRAGKVIAFIHKYCRVPEGKLVGQPLVLDKFQIDFIKDVYDNKRAITLTAILSIARKNGKTALIAALVLVHLVGPEARQNSQIVSGAQSRDQAALVFKLASKMVNLNEDLQAIVRIVPSGKSLLGLPMNVEYRALAADGTTAHGLSPVLAIIDEMGQVKGDQNDFIDAIETAQGAYDDALEIIISTQAPTDGDMLSIRIDDAIRSDDPSTVIHLHSADNLLVEGQGTADIDLLDPAAHRAANPALGSFRSAIELQTRVEAADRMPSMENSTRNLYLNQRVSRSDVFISPKIWKSGIRPPEQEAFDMGKVFGGLDLAETTDLCAFVYGAKWKNEWHVRCMFWKAEATLIEHAKRDRVPYDRWASEGFLLTSPGIAVDYEVVAADIAKELEGLDVEGIAYDRYRFKTLEKKFGELEDAPDLPFVPWGQGYVSMAPAIDAAEIEFLNKRIRHGGHPVLTMCAANAVVIRDPANNRKLDKSKSTGRIDGMQALVQMIGLASSIETEEDESSIYEKRDLVVL
ncbi:MAG: terminase [Alphaproteobacteria bacterium CG_4_10_14_0_8_um_filter_53_9]|nr:MAG: terminase [Alphaproteobacteria bacterium CG_4_10_14_0_8_um_filter_53_9]